MIPETSTTLLRDIASSAANARWGEFCARYEPMMRGYLRERFPYVEADDVVQETLVALAGALPDYILKEMDRLVGIKTVKDEIRKLICNFNIQIYSLP